LLDAYCEGFQKLFKAKANFATWVPRNPESEQAYAVDDQDHLSTRFDDIKDLVHEAAHLGGRNSHAAVTATDVRAAEDARRFRQNLVEERLQEALLKGTLLVETAGKAVGRINGLSVLSSGDHSFGVPTRLTATVAPGRRGEYRARSGVERPLFTARAS
jgi:predicted ATP-dependent protease